MLSRRYYELKLKNYVKKIEGWSEYKNVNIKDNLFILHFHILRHELKKKMENDDISVSIKTAKISGSWC